MRKTLKLPLSPTLKVFLNSLGLNPTDLSSKLITTVAKDKKYKIYNEDAYEVVVNQLNKMKDIKKLEFIIHSKENFAQQKPKISKVKNTVAFDNNSNKEEKRKKIDQEIEKFVNFIIEEKEETKKYLNEQKEFFDKKINEELYNKEGHSNYVKEMIYINTSDQLGIPTLLPTKLDDTFHIDAKCNYCDLPIQGVVFECTVCNLYICQDCNLRFTEYAHRHKWSLANPKQSES